MKPDALPILIASVLSGLGAPEILAPTAAAATFAEKLGWPPGTRVVIFHIDDGGMCRDSNAGTFQAVGDGLGTSFSIMMPCPAVPEAVEWVKAHPGVDAGLHLTLNAEWQTHRWGPVAGKAAVPGLVDEQGCLWHQVAQTNDHASADEFETEVRAQIAKACAMGLAPTHLDTHMGTCLRPKFVRRYIKVGRELGIPVLMFGGHMQHIRTEVPLLLRPLVCLLSHQVWSAGLPVLDDLVTSPTTGPTYEDRKCQFMELLKGLKPGVTQIILHCTLLSEEFRRISSSGGTRHDELKLMLDPDVRAWVAEQAIVPTTWRELMQRRARTAGARVAAPPAE